MAPQPVHRYPGDGGIGACESSPHWRQRFQDRPDLPQNGFSPAFKARLLGLEGWFSANILGNRDGEVLDDPEAFRTKEESKLSVLEYILQPDLYPDLYGHYDHKVRISYYPPRGDNKEGWDNIDIFGWLGYPMQIKVNFLCRDSILAAPLVLDLALFFDLASAPACTAFRNGSPFTLKARCFLRDSILSMISSFN